MYYKGLELGSSLNSGPSKVHGERVPYYFGDLENYLYSPRIETLEKPL